MPKAKERCDDADAWEKIKASYYSRFDIAGYANIIEPEMIQRGPLLYLKLFLFCVVCPLNVAAILYNVKTVHGLSGKFYPISLALECTQIMIKVIYVFLQSKRFKTLILKFAEFDCVRQYPKESRAIMIRVASKISNIGSFWWTSVYSTIAIFIACPFVLTPSAIFFGSNSENAAHALASAYPFRVDFHPMPLLVNIFEATGVLVFGLLDGGGSFFIITLTFILSGMFRVLNHAVESDVTRTASRVKDHQRLLRLASEARYLLSPVALLQILVSLISLSIAILTLFDGRNGGQSVVVSVHTISYIFATFTNFIFLCWISDNLGNAVQSTREAIYMNDWHERISEIDVKAMTITSLRCQRPFRLTAMGFIELKLTTVIEVTKAAFSYYTVLKRLGH